MLTPLFGIFKAGYQWPGADSDLAVVFATPLTIRSNQPILSGDTVSLRRKTMSQRAQRWEISAQVCPTVGSSDYLVHAITYGHSDTFEVRMPQIPKTLYSNAILTVTNDLIKGDISCQYTRDTFGDLLPGEFIQFDSMGKVYMVVSVDTATREFTIFPPLLGAIPAGTAIFHGSSVTLYAKLELDTLIGMTFIDGLLMDPGTINLIEDVGVLIEEGGGEP